ncbi:immunoglobulin-like domain-containing protein [Listeria rustica]|nr:immunoglobulin-like domain-containing protein [Listeria rustica]
MKATFLKIGLVALMTCSLLPSFGGGVNSEAHAEVAQMEIHEPETKIEVISMENSSFENPVVTDPLGWHTYDASQVPGWHTTASDNLIEIQTSKLTTPQNGSQYAELNAYKVGALYQDIETTPGAKIRWKVSHRGVRGVDTASLKFGAPGDLKQVATLQTDNTAWKTYSGTYTVPEGQTTTRFQFESISSAGGVPDVGNLLDNMTFATQSFITVDATAPTSIKQNQTGTYTFTAKNEGGMASQDTTLTIPIPEEVDYQPDSVTVDGVPINATYDSGTRTLSVPLANIEKDASKVVKFDVKGMTVADAISTQATVTHQDEDFTDTTYTNYSQEVETSVLPNTVPVLTATDQVLAANDVFDPKQGVTATDAEDGDLTDAVVVTANDVDTTKSGTYHVTYSVTDSDGNEVTKTITVTVQEPPIITGEANTRLNPDSTFDPMSTIQATDAEDGDLTDQVVITSNDVDTSKPGTYQVVYSVTDSDANTTEFTRSVVVTEVPVITGATDVTLQLGESFDPMEGVYAADKEDGDLTSKLQVGGTIDVNQAGVYGLSYSVSDSDGNTGFTTRIVTVHDNTIFEFNEAPEDLAFETTEIRDEEVNIARENPDWNLEVKDTRNNGNPWEVTAMVNGPFIDLDDPDGKKLHNALTYTDGTTETRLLDNQAFVIGEGVSDEDEVTTIQSPEEEGLHMKVNPTGVKAGDHYQTSITWSLNDTP